MLKGRPQETNHRFTVRLVSEPSLELLDEKLECDHVRTRIDLEPAPVPDVQIEHRDVTRILGPIQVPEGDLSLAVPAGLIGDDRTVEGAPVVAGGARDGRQTVTLRRPDCRTASVRTTATNSLSGKPFCPASRNTRRCGPRCQNADERRAQLPRAGTGPIPVGRDTKWSCSAGTDRVSRLGNGRWAPNPTGSGTVMAIAHIRHLSSTMLVQGIAGEVTRGDSYRTVR